MGPPAPTDFNQLFGHYPRDSDASPYLPLWARYLVPDDDHPKTIESIKEIYGKVETMTDRKQADFLLRLIAHSKFEPDYLGFAISLGLNSDISVYVFLATAVATLTICSKQRFRAICDINDFDLEGNQVLVANSRRPELHTVGESELSALQVKDKPTGPPRKKAKTAKDLTALSKVKATKDLGSLNSVEGPSAASKIKKSEAARAFVHFWYFKLTDLLDVGFGMGKRATKNTKHMKPLSSAVVIDSDDADDEQTSSSIGLGQSVDGTQTVGRGQETLPLARGQRAM
jgi:hypothetical protein